MVETELQIMQIDNELTSEVGRDLREADAGIGVLIERNIAARDQLRRIDIRAPRTGTAHESSVHTLGGVIGLGEQLMVIVPEADDLDVEVKVAPQDIDQLSIGQPPCCASRPSTSAPRRRSAARSARSPPT